MGYNERDTLFLFLDESGNLDFRPNGSRYWSLTAFCTFHPAQNKERFLDLLYSLADEGGCQEYFHATEDRQAVRDRVFALIAELGDGHEVHSVIAEKCKASPSLYTSTAYKKGKKITVKDDTGLYRVVCKALLRYILGCPRFQHAQKVVAILSSLFTRDKHEAIRKALTVELKGQAKIPFGIYFHENKADLNCQIADYCGWAIGRKWELSDRRSYDLIRTQVRNEFPIFGRGTTTYYECTKGRA